MPSIETKEVFKGDERVVINACDVPDWESRGWSTSREPSPEPQGDQPAAATKPAKKS